MRKVQVSVITTGFLLLYRRRRPSSEQAYCTVKSVETKFRDCSDVKVYGFKQKHTHTPRQPTAVSHRFEVAHTPTLPVTVPLTRLCQQESVCITVIVGGGGTTVGTLCPQEDTLLISNIKLVFALAVLK